MPRKKIHLSDVQTLTFQRGELTRSNKNQRVDKVTCLGGCEVVGSDVISQARCKNDGIDDMGDVNWRCTASIPKGCRFYETTVSCERFRDENGNFDPDDDFIVPGSCAFEYVLDCERLSEAQEEELKSKQKIEDERLKQHEMMLAEVRRAKDQATIDACELAIASALYPVNTPVSMGSYSHGHISEINCDGLYSVSLNGAVRRHVKESDLSPYVEPQYVMYDDTYSRRPTYTQPHRRRRASTTTSNSYSGSYGESSSQHDSGWETTFGIAVLVVIVLFYLLFCKSSRGTHTPRRTATTRSTTTRTTTRNNNPNPPSPHHERANTRRRHGNISNNQYAKLGVAAALNAASMYNSRSTGSTASNNLYRRTSTTSKTKRDVAKEEQIRSTKIKGLAELQKSRVVAKTAELKHNEDARKREYETRMNQSQRNVTNDTQQHGNQMRRTDHVKDRHEAASYAKTKFR